MESEGHGCINVTKCEIVHKISDPSSAVRVRHDTPSRKFVYRYFKLRDKRSKILVTVVPFKVEFSRSFNLLADLISIIGESRQRRRRGGGTHTRALSTTERPINNVGEYIPLRTRYVFLRGRHRDPSSISINVNDDERARARDAFYRQSALTRAK